MRKLFLVLFLFALTSNTLANDEIWKCDFISDYHNENNTLNFT